MGWRVAFTGTEWLAKTGEKLRLLIRYERIPRSKLGTPDEASLTSYGTITVSVTRSVLTEWGLEEADRRLEAQLVEHAKRFAADRLRARNLPQAQQLGISTYAAHSLYDVHLEKYRIPWAFDSDNEPQK